MSRTILLVRHAKSVGGRHDRHLYPKEGAPLDDKGFDDAAKLKSEFLDRGINLVTEPVAVSQLVRTRQTAEWAGLKNIKEYASLNEVNSGLSPEELDFVIKNKQVPAVAVRAARRLLKNPPNEKIWVTHGTLIAAIAYVLGIPADELYIPEMASVVDLKIHNI
jgi:broad specificity phosphatase PhoE